MLQRFLCLMTVLALLLGTAPGCAAEEPAPEVSEEELLAAAEQACPGWTVVSGGLYASGRWEDRTALWEEVRLARVDRQALCQRALKVLVNPLKKGEPVPWEITDWAPVPLTAEAEAAALRMDPADLCEAATDQVAPELLPGCAAFLLDGEETWEELFAFPDGLAGIVLNAGGQECVRIARWDGEQYGSTVSSRFHSQPLTINGYESWIGAVAVNEKLLERQPDGRWLFTGLTDGDCTLYRIAEDFVTDASYNGCRDSNDLFHYGVYASPRDLTEVDIHAISEYTLDAVRLLDSSAFACAKADGTPMLSSPGGEKLADCFARAAGRIVSRQDGWVQLRIGGEEGGLTGWFAEEDLAFGPEIEDVRCGFPSHSEEDCGGSRLRQVLRGEKLPGLTEPLWETMHLVWLIGRLPDGGWLVQLDADTVCTAADGSFTALGPPTDARTETEEAYREYEEWLLEMEDEFWDDWEED